MKTKNAFAFRDFDSARILQRPFFKNFYFDSNKSDAEILDSLNTVNEDSVDSWEKNLYAIKAIHDRLAEFRHLINRHNENRLDKYNKKKSKLENVKISELQRPAPVMEYFSASLSILELMNKFKSLYSDIEKKIQVRYRKDFGSRLKRIRQDLKLTQKQFGDLIRVSPQVFSFYERGEHDIPVHTIIRLAKALNMSGNQILGIE
ncbi:MAG: helix-turn-helix transcriptional regulator [Selenomonadaceae bacterium]|nr:helix-turn-helix transcriptional regulator [Selenomonadaceae bacterium]